MKYENIVFYYYFYIELKCYR